MAAGAICTSEAVAIPSTCTPDRSGAHSASACSIDPASVAGGDPLPFRAGAEWADPVSVPNGDTPGRSEYSGTWLASVHRVRVGPDQVDTGWVVLVQERRDDVLQPVRDLQWRLGYVGLAATVSVLVLVALMWFGMMSGMDSTSRSPVTRLLRRWAGLPTSGTVGTSGHFTMWLPPGTYRLSGHNPRVRAGQHEMRCAAPHPVHARAGSPTPRVEVVCPAP